MQGSLIEYLKTEIAYNLKQSKNKRNPEDIRRWYQGKASGIQMVLNANQTWTKLGVKD